VRSKPGQTVFTCFLPVAPPGAASPEQPEQQKGIPAKT
jgi:hypothetical protein